MGCLICSASVCVCVCGANGGSAAASTENVQPEGEAFSQMSEQSRENCEVSSRTPAATTLVVVCRTVSQGSQLQLGLLLKGLSLAHFFPLPLISMDVSPLVLFTLLFPFFV